MHKTCMEIVDHLSAFVKPSKNPFKYTTLDKCALNQLLTR